MSESRSTAKSEVVLLATHKKLATHETVVQQALGNRIARLLGATFAGAYDPALHKDHALYYIPSDTLIGKRQGEALNIRTADDFFGGLIDYPFMATKAISHPLITDATSRPEGWSDRFLKTQRTPYWPVSACSMKPTPVAQAVCCSRTVPCGSSRCWRRQDVANWS